MGKRNVLFECSQPPGVVEHEYVIGANTEHNEDGKDVEDSEVAIAEDDPVDEVGAAEASCCREQDKRRETERIRLPPHVAENEHVSTSNESQVPEHGLSYARLHCNAVTVKERHVADACCVILVTNRHECLYYENLHLRLLLRGAVRVVGVTGQWQSKKQIRPRDVDNGDIRVNDSASGQTMTERTPCLGMLVRRAYHPADVSEVGVVEDGVESRVGAIEETQYGHRLDAV